MIRDLQEHLANIQLQGGNNSLLEWLMQWSYRRLKKQFPQIWIRNSYYFKAHHPLASDIDVTYVGDSQTAKKLFSQMKRNKLFGELNFYPQEILSSLICLINPYELERDPILLNSQQSMCKSSTQKEVFLARHILGDSYWLQRHPQIRIQKWKYLFAILNENLITLSLDTLIQQTSNASALRFYLDHEHLNLFDIFKTSPFRSLFPHKHMWEDTDRPYLIELSLNEANLFLEQIKWEFWGIGTQLHWIDLEISYHFLVRLKKMAEMVNAPFAEITAMNDVLNFISKLNPTNH